MKHKFQTMGLFLILFLLAFQVVAQEESSNRFTDEDFPLGFETPLDFEVSLAEEGEFVSLDGDAATLRLYPSDFIDSILEENTELTVEEILLAFLVQAEVESEAEVSDITMIEAEFPVYLYEGADYQAYLFLSAIDNSILGFLTVEGEFSEEAVISFASSIEIMTSVCLVSTEQERTVRIHVGPGENRTSIAYLPVGEEFIVLGEAEAADGSRWFKLDKNEVAPSSSALEAWISADAVTQTGNCEAISEAFAPPIIPIISQTNSGSTSENTGEDSDSTDSNTNANPVITGTGAVDPNNLGNPVSTIMLRDGVYSPPTNPNSFIVVRMNEQSIEMETCYMLQDRSTGQCLLNVWRLVGTNIFFNNGSYVTVQSTTGFSAHYFFSNGTNSIGFAYWVRESLPDDLHQYSVLENR